MSALNLGGPPFRLFAMVTIGVATIEGVIWQGGKSGPELLDHLFVGRLVALAFMLGLIGLFRDGFVQVGLMGMRWRRGIRLGFLWSLGFGGCVLFVGGVLHVIGWDVVDVLARKGGGAKRLLFLFTMVGISPLVEEIFFRGVVYGFFRRFGVPVALVISTVFFAYFHLSFNFGGVIIPLVGGVLFAISFEQAGHLATPMVIHVFGNASLYFLSRLF